MSDRRPGPVRPEAINADVATRLEEVAHLLHQQEANPFRVQAWRGAADAIRTLQQPVNVLFQLEGLEGLDRIPGIGPVTARAVRDLVLTGRLPMLGRLRGDGGRSSVLASVPGVGRVLAERVHETLGIETLEELETAAHDGRLASVPGFGAKRIQGIRDALASRLGQWRQRGAPARGATPPVEELLSVDAEYRDKAERGVLRTIAPRRFNPRHEAWLPVLHTRRGDRHYTALFSNTARAHELGRTHDWVVLYHDGADGERSSTVVTAHRGALAGRRVVRGRELECEHAERTEEAGSGAAAR